MFSIIKLAIWLAGIGTIAYFALPYFGYELNLDYFKQTRSECQDRLKECQQMLLHNGVDGAKNECLEQFRCVDPKLLIRKQ